jgi:hypothetical protein
MFQLAEGIGRDTLDRLSRLTTNHLPGFFAALFIFLVAWGLAAAVGWWLRRIFHGARLDQFLRRSGLASLLPGDGLVRTTRIVARGAYWTILAGGLLLALSAFDTQLTSRMIDWVLYMVPKFFAGGMILLAGAWLSRYLGRAALVWAFNEGIPNSRWIGQAVRNLVIFATLVVAADYLDFARSVFLASFILVIGGAMLAGGLALGLGGRRAVERYFERRNAEREQTPEEAAFKHL